MRLVVSFSIQLLTSSIEPPDIRGFGGRLEPRWIVGAVSLDQ